MNFRGWNERYHVVMCSMQAQPSITIHIKKGNNIDLTVVDQIPKPVYNSGVEQWRGSYHPANHAKNFKTFVKHMDLKTNNNLRYKKNT